jgi:DNA polymerase-3 subunit delta
MIIKFFELKKKNLKNYNYFLLYGNNSGLIEETLNNYIKPLSSDNIFTYDESEIIKNSENFIEDISNKSFFDKEKLIIIRRATDKIFNITEEIITKKIEDITLILLSNILEKKSKLRTLFEKDKNIVCIPFYEDNQQSLNLLVQNFLKQKKITLSQQNINLILERCRGDRINLYNELNKIESFLINKKSANTDDILKLTNLSENISFNELIDNTLAKNQKKTLYILNENNFAPEDSVLILRLFSGRLKRLHKIQSQIKIKNNIEEAISGYRPPVFWKEKDVLKKQIETWTYEQIENLIFKTNSIELLIKKNPTISTNIVTNFLLEQSS